MALDQIPADIRQQYKPEMRKVPDGQMMRPNRKTNGSGVQAQETRICVVMVGLPARGKSLIAQKGNLNLNSLARLLLTYSISRPLPSLVIDRSKNLQRWPIPSQ